jgi:tetratricopeptide (TPR) repeat protein
MWMERLDVEEAEQQFKLARKALEEEDFTTALTHLEKALELHDNPDWHSYAGLRIALERGDYLVAEHLCLASIEHDEGNSAHYLNLGKVYLAAGKKSEALETLREGMARGRNERILALLFQLGKRNPPVFSSLKRTHPLNKYLGIILHRRALRRRGLP